MELEPLKLEIEAAVPGCRLEIIPNLGPSAQHSLLVDPEHGLAVAFYLNFALGSLRITETLGAFVAGLGHSTTGLMWVLAIFYFLLGIFFETLPMMVGTVPIIFPIAVATGIDPIWFGVFMVLQCELSLLSPPVGMTLYVIQAVRREGNIKDVFAGTIPFVAAMVLMTAILIHFPELALWIPRLLFGPS